MDIVKHYGCYDYNEEWYLIELILDVSTSEIDWSNIFVPEHGTNKEGRPLWPPFFVSING